MNIYVKRLVIKRSSKGKIYSSFRKCKMIDNKGTFWVEEEVTVGTKQPIAIKYYCYLMHKTKLIIEYSECMAVIDGLIKSYQRDLKLKEIGI